MKILQITQMNRGINYYRHWQYAKYLNQRGHTIGCTPESAMSPYGYEATAVDSPEWLLANADKYDAIWSTIPFEPNKAATLLGLREALYRVKGIHAPLIIDIDDLINDIPAYNMASKVAKKTSDRVKIAVAILRAADAITTTCNFLADKVRPLNPRVFITPNCVEPPMWNHPRPIKDDGKVRVLWTGSSARWGDIMMMKDTLFWLHDNYGEKVKLILTASCPDFAVPWVDQGFAYVTQWAPIPDYMMVMRYVSADIGLAPLLPNDFNRSKSPLKYLDHAMIGCAGIYSRECTYDVVAEDYTGLKASTPEEWQIQLKRLIENPILRTNIAAASYVDVMRRFNIETQIPSIEATLQQAINVGSLNISAERSRANAS